MTRRHWPLAALTLACPLLLAPMPAPGETLGEMYRRVNPSVVVIRARGAEVTEGGLSRFGEIGSGVLISADGKIATAAHVVHTIKSLATLQPGQELRATILRGEKVQELRMPWSGR